MWRKYSSELCIGVVVINLAFSVWAWTNVQRQVASLRQGASGSQQIPSGFPPGAGLSGLSGPADEGASPFPGGVPAIPPEFEKQLKEMNAQTPPVPVMGATGDPRVPPPGGEQPPPQKEQPKK